MIMLLALTLSAALAKDLPGEELYVAPKEAAAAAQPPKRTPQQSSSIVHNKKTLGQNTDSNLPQNYFIGSHRQSTDSELILPPKTAIDTLRSLKVGDKLEATIHHSIIAFPDEKAPVVADLTSREAKHIKLIGESRLEKNSHRIFIEFTRAVQNGKVYNLKASALTDLGTPGFEGSYHSRELEYFSGDFISSFVAGYFDGLVPRTRNAFGQLEEDNTVDAAFKKGMSKGAMSSAERFRQKLQQSPEFSELPGPLDIQILILDQPINKTN